MHKLCVIPVEVIQSNVSVFDVFTFSVTLVAVGIAIWQYIIARHSLNIAKETLEDDIKTRQVSMLPEMYGVILVQTALEQWVKKIEEIKNKIIIAFNNKDENLIKSISSSSPKTVKDVNACVYINEKTSGALKQILISGAQYYYDALAPASNLWKEDKQIDWSFTLRLIERLDDSLVALKKLKDLLSKIVPDVILNTPASINDSDFLKA